MLCNHTVCAALERTFLDLRLPAGGKFFPWLRTAATMKMCVSHYRMQRGHLAPDPPTHLRELDTSSTAPVTRTWLPCSSRRAPRTASRSRTAARTARDAQAAAKRVRAVTSTAQKSCEHASSFAIARPSPRFAPVTTATSCRDGDVAALLRLTRQPRALGAKA